MQDDAESIRLPDGEMPQIGGRLPAIEEELIEGGINLSEELVEEARAEESLGETEEPAKPQTKEGLLLRAIESNQEMVRAILEALKSRGLLLTNLLSTIRGIRCLFALWLQIALKPGSLLREAYGKVYH